MSATAGLDRSSRAGVGLLIAIALCGLLAPWISPYDPGRPDLRHSLEGPSLEHWLGTDVEGRDVASRILYGARVSLSVALAVVVISVGFGVLIGGIAGLFGGWVDRGLSAVIDVLLAFPGILLAIALIAITGPGLGNVILALTLLGWVSFARLVRGEVLVRRGDEFVVAARALGATQRELLLRHLLPNLVGPVTVQATFAAAGAILAEASLSFLGLGVQGLPSWGGMLDHGADVFLLAPHLAIAPGLAILLSVVALNFVGDGLRDWLDPRTATASGQPGL
ncbi:MAG: ABC transporter permease [Myxococcota bacterium]|nr:ABC transporter permease [Myxococcota bacterium]